MKSINTFSIVAHERATNSWGVAVASKFLAVGAVVPVARAGVGALATQALANLGYGTDGLALLEVGLPADVVLARLTQSDAGRDQRQLGLVDAHGRAATFTGKACMDWAGGIASQTRDGDGFAVQGNLLAGPQVVQAMAAAFVGSSGTLAARLLAAVRAGDDAGGDRRGRQSAALLVVRPGGGYGGMTDRYLDLRVDDHAQPVSELQRVLVLHDLYFGVTPIAEKIKIMPELWQELQSRMRAAHAYAGPQHGLDDAATRSAWRAFTGTENLEERVDIEASLIDPPALAYIRERFPLDASR